MILLFGACMAAPLREAGPAIPGQIHVTFGQDVDHYVASFVTFESKVTLPSCIILSFTRPPSL